jgi:hypothetical protein
MYSDELKLVFGFEPSGLFENVILAPGIGIPRTLLSSPRGCDEESESEVTGVSAEVVVVVSVLMIFGILILGSGNWPNVGSARKDPTAMAAIRISDDDLVINIVLSECRSSVVEAVRV